MNNSIRYQLLNKMGIPVFKSRSTFEILQSEKLFLTPSCLVVLPYSPTALTAQSQKVLTGMLKVLEINNDHICTTWLKNKIIDHNSFKSFILAVTELTPLSVLILGDILNKERLDEWINSMRSSTYYIKTTFHPDIFETKPEYKKQAFQDLLQLKNYLHTDIFSYQQNKTWVM